MKQQQEVAHKEINTVIGNLNDFQHINTAFIIHMDVISQYMQTELKFMLLC